jgi:ABC transport system ATP-binding/permease protein
MFSLTIEDQNGQVADTFSFDHGSYVIGRLDDCDIVLPSSSVSRRHARIFIQDGRCYIEDMESANGVIVDGQRVLKTRDLGTASQIRVGDYYLYLEFQQASKLQNQDVRSTLFIDSGSDHHKLVRINDSFAGEEFSLSEQENTIGRTDDNFILLSDTSISRNHAVIIHHGDLYAVEDKKSSNGTRLNGKPVTGREPLRAGDRVEFGNVEFIFVPGSDSVDLSAYAPRGGDRLTTYAGMALLGVIALVVVSVLIIGGLKLTEDRPDPGAVVEARLTELIATGESQLSMGNWEAATASFDEALTIAPEHEDARRLRAQVQVEREAAEILARGESLSEQGLHLEARELLLQIDPETLAARRAEPTLAHLNRTISYNLKSEATREFRRGEGELLEIHTKIVQALQIVPDDREARDLLAEVEGRLSEEGIEFEPHRL